MSIMFKEL